MSWNRISGTEGVSMVHVGLYQCMRYSLKVLEGCQNQVFVLFCDDTCSDYPNQEHENHAHG